MSKTRLSVRIASAALSWIDLFRASSTGVEIEDGSPTVEITVPGMVKDNGSPNNKGNVVVSIAPEERYSLMGELRKQMVYGREASPAEMVRRTFQWIDQGTDGASDVYASFRVSAESGARTVKVREADVPAFLADFEAKLDSAVNLWDEYVAASETPDADADLPSE